MKATPLISSTLASAVVFLLMKLAVIAIASLPLNSFLLKPGRKKDMGREGKRETMEQKHKKEALSHNYKAAIIG